MGTASVPNGTVPEMISGSIKPSLSPLPAVGSGAPSHSWEQSMDEFLKSLDGRTSNFEQSHALYEKCVLVTCSSDPEFKGWLIDVGEIIRVERQSAFDSFNGFSPAVATLKFRAEFATSLLEMWASGDEPNISVMAALRRGDLGFGGSIRALRAFRDVLQIANSERQHRAASQMIVQRGVENTFALEEMMDAFYSKLVSVEDKIAASVKDVREQQAKYDPPEPPPLLSWLIQASLILVYLTVGMLIGAFVPLYILIGGGFLLIGLLSILNKITNGISNRTIETYVFSFKVIACYVLTRSNARELVAKGDQEAADELWEITHDYWGAQLYKFFKKHGGLWHKVGQYVSARADIFPQAFVKRLGRLQDELPQQATDEIHKIIEKEMGKPVDSIFDEFDGHAIGSASIAQVHRAKLKTGETVAVKVKKRGVDPIIQHDIRALRVVSCIIAYLDRDVDHRQLLKLYGQQVLGELDFTREGYFMDKVREIVMADDDINDPTRVIVPKLYKCSKSVIIMEFIHGFKVTNSEKLDYYHVDKKKMCEAVVAAMGRQLHIGGIFNADAHPGNIMIQIPENADEMQPEEVGKVCVPALLDFGNSTELSKEKRKAYAYFVNAAATKDSAGLLTAWERMGIKLKDAITDPSRALKSTRFLLRDSEPSDQARKNAGKFLKWSHEDRQKRKKEGKQSKLRLQEAPAELIPVMRMINLLQGLCSQMEQNIPIMKKLVRFAKQAIIEKSSHEEGDEANRPERTRMIKTGYEVLGESLQAIIQNMRADGRILGAQVCVVVDSCRVVDIAAGEMGPLDPSPVKSESLFPCFGVTNAIAALAFHSLSQAGKRKNSVEMDAPVSKYWPEFAANGKDSITVTEMLSHRAGLQYALPDIMSPTLGKADVLGLCDWKEMMKHILSSAPESDASQKGSIFHYWTYGWLLGGLSEAAFHRDLDEYLRTDVSKTLSVEKELFMKIPIDEVQSDRIAGVYTTAFESQNNEAEVMGQLSEDIVENVGRIAKEMSLSMESLIGGNEWLLEPRFVDRPDFLHNRVSSINGRASARALAELFTALIPPCTRFQDSPEEHEHGIHLLSTKAIHQACEEVSSGSSEEGGGAIYSRGFRIFRFERMLRPSRRRDSGADNGLCKTPEKTPRKESVLGYGDQSLGSCAVIVVPDMHLSFAVTLNLVHPESVLPKLIDVIASSFGIRMVSSQ